MEEKKQLELVRDEWFNTRINQLESDRKLSLTHIHVLKSLYAYGKNIERQLVEDFKDIKEFEEEVKSLVEMQQRIENELNKYCLLPSESKAKRKVNRKNKKIG